MRSLRGERSPPETGVIVAISNQTRARLACLSRLEPSDLTFSDRHTGYWRRRNPAFFGMMAFRSNRLFSLRPCAAKMPTL